MRNAFVMAGLCVVLAIGTDSMAATYSTLSGGAFDGAIWNTPGGGFPDLNDGDILHIDHNVIVNGNIPINAKITIYIDAVATFSGRLTLEEGSIIYLLPAGKIVSTGTGNSDHIKIGNSQVWKGDDGDKTGPGGFIPTWQAGALPIKLSYFSAQQNEQVVLLSWATTMEENFQKFIVERSGEGLFFDEIGGVEGLGFNIYDIESKYSFVDEAPLSGFNYYRLKAIDLDNSFEYFGVKAVKISAPKKVTVYPNPSSGESIVFRSNFSPRESDRIVIIDQLGIELLNVAAGGVMSGVSFPERLRSGIYLLRYVSEGFEQTTRIVIKN